VLYFADQCHLIKYGRFITGDRYVAMKHGPVPSDTYDLFKSIRDNQQGCYGDHLKQYIAIRERFYIDVERDADMDFFSDSDQACLDQSIAENGALSFAELTEKSHDSVYDLAEADDFIPLSAFARLADNSDDLLAHLDNPNP